MFILELIQHRQNYSFLRFVKKNKKENICLILFLQKTHSLKMKGAFFCEYSDSPPDALYFSIGYSFEIKRNTPIWITIEPTISHYHSGRQTL